MNILLPVLSIYILSSVADRGLSNSCPMELYVTYKDRLRVICSEKCQTLDVNISDMRETWTGFCTENRFILFRNWQCEYSNETDIGTFVIITESGCILSENAEDISESEMDCWRKHNTAKCKRDGERRSRGKNSNIGSSGKCHHSNGETGNGKEIDSKYGMENSVSAKRRHPDAFVLGEITEEIHFPRDSLRDDGENWENSSTALNSCDETSSDLPLPESASPESGSIAKRLTSGAMIPFQNQMRYHDLPSISPWCKAYETFFGDYCYSFKTFKYDKKEGFISNDHKRQDLLMTDLLANSTKSCRTYHWDALGLAVETIEENQFVLEFLRSQNLTDESLVLTSGILPKGMPGQWQDWDMEINESVIECKSSPTTKVMLYTINSRTLKWELVDFTNLFAANKNNEWYILCKTAYNPRNIQNDLYKRCLKMYRGSACYHSHKFIDYCCAFDEYGEIWFGCPNEINIKETKNGLECTWYCGDNGMFIQEFPTCRKGKTCDAVYNNIQYSAPFGRHAIGQCPPGLSGYSTWYCSNSGTFLGKPNYVCCSGIDKCQTVDPYLNVWVSCPNEMAIKKVVCPPDSLMLSAVANWYCNENYEFDGLIPDYRRCKQSSVECLKMDKYGRQWKASAGSVAWKYCPKYHKEKCFWKCRKAGQFDTPEPDCSKCSADWLNDVTDRIKNGTHYKTVMRIMENHTRTEDLTLGFSQVLNLTSACVDLFKQQTPSNKTAFSDFLIDYSKILKNVAGKPDIWATFLVSSRKEYTTKILKTTQSATFSYLTFPFEYNDEGEEFNATLADFEKDGFDFFVLYNSSMSGVKFPLENKQKSNWGLEVKEVNETGSKFAAMGLIMNYSLSQLMFPSGNDTWNLTMNAPAVSFSVATSGKGESTLIPKVSISITFKHSNKTRYPHSGIIKRKLHEGETPSGVFGSTVCYYFSRESWTSEGCSVTYVSSDETTCTCKHLSTIGLLMSIHKYEPDAILEIISLTSSCISIIALILSLIIFLSFDNIKNDRVLIGFNLCLCLLTGHILLITVMDKKFFFIPDNLCAIYAVLLHYVFMAAFAWMFLEGCHLYRMLILVFESNIDFRCIYIMTGYGMPLLIVGLTELIGIILQEQPYGQDELCWLKTPNFVWAFNGPVIILTSINFVILIVAMKLAIATKMKTEKSNCSNLRMWIKGCFSLSALLGITWLFGLVYIHYNQVFAYAFNIFNGLQGFFIFFFRCVCNTQYRAAFFQKLKLWFHIEYFSTFKKPENAKSVTKLFAITPSSTKLSGSEVDSGLVLNDVKDGKDKSLLSKCPKIFFFMKSKKDANEKKITEEETSSGIGLELERGNASSRILRGQMPGMNNEKESHCENAKINNGDDDLLWNDPNDFPELSYHYRGMQE